MLPRLFTPLLMTAVLAAEAAFAFGTPEHSTVSAKATSTATGVDFEFIIKPKENMSVTFDAPWQLEITRHDGLNFAKTKFDKAELNEKLPGFKSSATTADKKASGNLEYKLIAFICTKDKTKCFREVHTNKLEWKR